jgi:hypothetical protein
MINENVIRKKCAIVLLAYSDYESLELALACHAKCIEEGENYPTLYIIQNGHGTYDTERTTRVGQRYADLYPTKIILINRYSGKPYFSIKSFLQSDEAKNYDYIIKIDDDVLPISSAWVRNLCNAYAEANAKYKNDLAYVTGLVNNNPYGFKKTINVMGLENEYYTEIARDHFIGLFANDPYSPYRMVPASEIGTGGGGTVWRYPYIARWIHQKTTLNPLKFIKATENLGIEEINTRERYSINCLLFKKELWYEISNGGFDDELMLQQFCIKRKKKAFVALNVPLCHLFFWTQRFENKDLLNSFYQCYESFLNLPYPIRVCQSPDAEIQERLRYLERKNSINKNLVHPRKKVGTAFVKKVLKYWLMSKLHFSKKKRDYYKLKLYFFVNGPVNI